jgi:hypothetical protein
MTLARISSEKGIIEASHRSVRHFPSCRRVAGEAVAARWQRTVDPWPVQNGCEGSGSRFLFAGATARRIDRGAEQMGGIKAGWECADFEVR